MTPDEISEQALIDKLAAKVESGGYASLGYYHGMGCHGVYGQTLDTCEIEKVGAQFKVTRSHERGSAGTSYVTAKGRNPRKLIAAALQKLDEHNDAEDERRREEIYTTGDSSSPF
jgi:hypothetical protein